MTDRQSGVSRQKLVTEREFNIYLSRFFSDNYEPERDDFDQLLKLLNEGAAASLVPSWLTVRFGADWIHQHVLIFGPYARAVGVYALPHVKEALISREDLFSRPLLERALSSGLRELQSPKPEFSE